MGYSPTTVSSYTLNGPRLNKRAAPHWAGPAYVKQPITALQSGAGCYKYQPNSTNGHDSLDSLQQRTSSYNKRQTRPVGPRQYALHSPTSRPTPLLATSGHHSSLTVLTCSLRTATASQLTGHHRHTAVPTHWGRTARYTCRSPLPAASLGRRAWYTRCSNLSTA